MTSGLLERIVCGVDGTTASLIAVRRAARLAGSGSELRLVAVSDDAAAAAASLGAAGVVLPPAAEELAEEWLDRAAQLVRADFPDVRVETRVLEGPLLPTLLRELSESAATLVAIGRHGHSRLAALVLGSVTTSLLHDAPCSVLVAGASPESTEPEPAFPRSILLGYDGSEPAAAAARAASELARRSGASLEALCATGGKPIALDRLQGSLTELAPGVPLTVQDGDPVQALTSARCDLLVVGSRGLHGLKALGSVSERVAHRADCSVLVVR